MPSKLKQYSSLEDALSRFGIPDGNRALIRTFVERLGIAAFYETSGYIKAVRTGGGPDLHIASGWTNGFVSEAEILEVAGDIDRWGDDERARVWGISHPDNRIGHGGGGPIAKSQRDYGSCPTCFIGFAANGECGCD